MFYFQFAWAVDHKKKILNKTWAYPVNRSEIRSLIRCHGNITLYCICISISTKHCLRMYGEVDQWSIVLQSMAMFFLLSASQGIRWDQKGFGWGYYGEQLSNSSFHENMNKFSLELVETITFADADNFFDKCCCYVNKSFEELWKFQLF